ncbi:MAG: histidine kinase N-terminal 7TM domain-containing protein, partial [Chloroflexota bacterium]|nr:histidine kinase N-terminal 7TM domain-containing protein [Chloroflexota bacterium]
MTNNKISPEERPPTFRNVVTSVAIGALFLVTIGVNLLAPILARQWTRQPFIGVLLEHTLIISSDEPTWPGHQADLRHPERILAADDQPVLNSAQLRALLSDRQPGETVVYTVESKDESGGWIERQVAVPLSTFPSSQLFVHFAMPYLAAVVYLVAGLWVYWKRSQSHSGRAFAIFCCAMAIVTGAMFDLNTTHWLVRLWCAALPLAAAALIHLALIYPQEHALVQRRPALCFVPYLPALVLASVNELYLYDFAGPRAYLSTWLASYVFLGLGMVIFVSLLIHTRQNPESSVVRQQSRIILLGTVLAYGPAAVWVVTSLLARLFPGMGLEVVFHPAIHVTPLALFPLAISY